MAPEDMDCRVAGAPRNDAVRHCERSEAIHDPGLHGSPRFARDDEAKPSTSHTLQVMHTPGHAANHLCLLLLEDGLLFSGDHILNGSTTVVDPPDGDMSDYLNSLDLLHDACTAHQLKYILPAHGYVIGGPGDEAQAAIARLKAHRLQREAKVLAAMQVQPNGTLDDWLALVYADVPQRMWPVAKRSLMAHVARLETLMP
jgi:recombination protein RecT